MPKPIQPSDIARWSRMLVLSDSQESVFNRAYEEYVRAEDATHGEFVQPLWDRSASIREGAPNHLGEERALQLQTLILEDRPQAVARIIAVEERLFSALEEVVSDPQAARLYEVRSQRDRARCNRQYSRYPGGHLDLLAVMAEFQARGMDCQATDAEALDQVVQEYDMLLTPLFSAASKAHIDVVAKSTVLQARMIDMHGSPELLAQQRRYNARLVAAEKRVHDLNARCVRQFAAVLPVPCGSALVQYFNEAAYPPVYPDPSDLAAWYEKVLGLPTLDQSRRDEIAALRALTELRREQVGAQLKAAYLSYREAFGIGGPGGSIDVYGAAAEDLHAQRIENARFAISTVSTMLTESELADIAPSSAAAEQRLTHNFLADPSRGR